MQVVEHFQPAYLTTFLDVAYHKLKPGSKIVLETLNRGRGALEPMAQGRGGLARGERGLRLRRRALLGCIELAQSLLLHLVLFV